MLTKEGLLAHCQVDENACWNWTKRRDKDGYGKVSADRRSYRTHRLAAHLWLGMPLDSRLFVLHRCDNPSCFNPRHLFIGTPQDNMVDRDRKGRLAYGERHGMSRFGVEQIKDIRARFEAGETRMEIAKSLGAGWNTINKIVSGETWRRAA